MRQVEWRWTRVAVWPASRWAMLLVVVLVVLVVVVVMVEDVEVGGPWSVGLRLGVCGILLRRRSKECAWGGRASGDLSAVIAWSVCDRAKWGRKS